MYTHAQHFYIGGRWVDPANPVPIPVVDPSTEREIASIAGGNAIDVAAAVASARQAFASFSICSRSTRVALLQRLLEACEERKNIFAQLLTREVGIPFSYAATVQIPTALEQIRQCILTLAQYEFEKPAKSTMIVREPIGVVGMITPWNWPLAQIVCKVAPALAAGCTMVLKPSELAPLSALAFAEAVQAAGIPHGVFNLVNGSGTAVGEPLAAHCDVDMISFTGSTRGGVAVSKGAADSVKRVTQELGGKSANIVLPDADLHDAVRHCVHACFANNGQTCDAPTRLLIHSSSLAKAERIAAQTAERYIVGDPWQSQTMLGPVVSQTQFDRIQELIASGLAEKAKVLVGGDGRPENRKIGYFVRPTIFSRVSPHARIATEEIFGPVLTIMSYESVDEAVEIANGTEFGLAAYVQSSNLSLAREIASRMRAGTVYINNPVYDPCAPFGGYKRSGNGREYGVYGLEEYLEVKSIVGHGNDV